MTLPVDSAGPDAGRWRRALSPLATIVSALLASLFLLFLVAPLVGLVGAGGMAGVRQLISDPELRGALSLTMLTATMATLVAIAGGTPIAYALARRRFSGRTLVVALLDLPLIVPHPVAGIALLLVLGRASPLGGILFAAGVRLTGSVFGIVCAMLFVAAPLYVGGAREVFTRVDPRYEAVARTLGDSAWTAFRRITVPLSLRGLTASAIVMWARAVSEFGAIVVLTYNPKVASVLSYDRFTTFGLSGALPVAAVLVLLAIIPLAALRALRRDE
ncbi:MAG TPA: ABC transporter permease [Gemmatimonadaceae bacterium]|nr:ABC transporter permease [Gemmatimonadaceae bacterium]